MARYRRTGDFRPLGQASRTLTGTARVKGLYKARTAELNVTRSKANLRLSARNARHATRSAAKRDMQTMLNAKRMTKNRAKSLLKLGVGGGRLQGGWRKRDAHGRFA